MTLHDDVELSAIQIVRAAATEQADPGTYAETVNEQLLEIQDRHGPEGVTAVAAALARLACLALAEARGTHDSAELLAVLDHLELYKIEHDQADPGEA